MSTREVVAAGRVPVPVRRPEAGAPWSLVPHLALVQARRVVRHPVLLLGLAWLVLGVGLGTPNTPYERYSLLTAEPVFLLAVPVFFAVSLVATSGRRAGVDEWTAALPLPPLQRTAGLLVAAAAPAAVLLVASLGHLVVVGGDTGVALLWQHVASPSAAVLGAALLAVAASRLLPWPGLPLLVVVAVVAANFWVADHWPYLGAYVDFVQWTDSAAIPAREPGSAGWHLAYLLSLCALAAAGALLPVVRRRWLAVAAGAVAGGVVLVAGYLQLP